MLRVHVQTPGHCLPQELQSKSKEMESAESHEIPLSSPPSPFPPVRYCGLEEVKTKIIQDEVLLLLDAVL